jgi:hypothetical protein
MGLGGVEVGRALGSADIGNFRDMLHPSAVAAHLYV